MANNSPYGISEKDSVGTGFEKLLRVMALLRSPKGCPWDREQTMDKLKPYLLEETYEVLEAMDDSPAHHCEELGDLLLQIVFQSAIAEEEGLFTARDVIKGIVDKLIRRHPHVFGEERATTAQGVVDLWEAVKREERNGAEADGAGDGDGDGDGRDTRNATGWITPVSTSVPAMIRALRVSKEAATFGFDWPSPEPVLAKIREEVEEIAQAMAAGDKEQIESEVGDLLFAATNLARHYRFSPEGAANQTVERFTDRFNRVMERLRDQGKDPSQATLEEMEALWQEVKTEEKGQTPGQGPKTGEEEGEGAGSDHVPREDEQ